MGIREVGGVRGRAEVGNGGFDLRDVIVRKVFAECRRGRKKGRRDCARSVRRRRGGGERSLEGHARVERIVGGRKSDGGWRRRGH